MEKKEFAESVGISLSTLNRLLAAGDVSCTHIGTRVREWRFNSTAESSVSLVTKKRRPSLTTQTS
jgi:predicted site-specific integrase-resolvase